MSAAASDPIVQESLRALHQLLGGPGGRGSGQQMQFRVENNQTAQTAQRSARSVPVTGLDGGVSVTTRGAGYMGVEDEPAGSALNPIAQLGIFTKIREEHDWLRFTSFAPVSDSTGYLDEWDDRNFRMKPMPKEGPRTGIPVHKPDVDQKTYSTKLMSGAFGLRLKALKNAARAGQNVNALVRRGIAAGIGNVIADLGVNGNTSLPTDTDVNVNRRVADGWWQLIRENGSNYNARDNGFSFHNRLWAGMLQQIDKAYRSDKQLAWGMGDALGTRWLTELTATGASPSNAHPSIINDLGSQLLNAMGGSANPLGKPGVVVPQIPEDSHSSGEGYSGVAPTSVTDNGDGTLTVNINTLAESGVNRSETGTDGQRYVRIGNANTGVEELLPVDYSAPNNTVTTTSVLGQGVVSTTAADYYVKWADTQSLFLGVMRMLTLVVQDGMRIYTVFYPHDERIEVIVHIDLDFMVVDYDGVALTDDIITPRFAVLPD